ncbi:MAG: TIGR02281 family clan AA aspartic protease [Pseudomonadota bacterium]|nr:TIGR02281 family clan AA aspartic protease [Pseudomonadota bacterium]
MTAWIALGVLVCGGLVLLLYHDAGTVAGLDTGQLAGLIAGGALLIYLGGSVFRDRGGIRSAFRDGIIWALLALVLVAGYSYRAELLPVARRVAGELLPGLPLEGETVEGGTAVRIRRQQDGQFIAQANVNDAAVNMVIDTGASQVVLTQDDARKAGIALEGLRYSVPVRTANGVSYAASVRLRSVRLGTLSLGNVEALVARPDSLHRSLLGMSFLSRLRSYEFSGDFLTLRS